MSPIGSEPQPSSKEKNPIDMEAFRVKIKALIIKRGNMPAETEMDLNQLTQEDADMWQKIQNPKNSPMTWEIFNKYKKGVMGSGNKTRERFLGTIIANAVLPLLM